MEHRDSGREQFARLAEELKALQANENGGRGVSVVRLVASCLERGNMQDAKQVCLTDADKIRNYPDIQAWLTTHLFDGDQDILV